MQKGQLVALLQAQFDLKAYTEEETSHHTDLEVVEKRGKLIEMLLSIVSDETHPMPAEVMEARHVLELRILPNLIPCVNQAFNVCRCSALESQLQHQIRKVVTYFAENEAWSEGESILRSFLEATYNRVADVRVQEKLHNKYAKTPSESGVQVSFDLLEAALLKSHNIAYIKEQRLFRLIPRLAAPLINYEKLAWAGWETIPIRNLRFIHFDGPEVQRFREELEKNQVAIEADCLKVIEGCGDSLSGGSRAFYEEQAHALLVLISTFLFQFLDH